MHTVNHMTEKEKILNLLTIPIIRALDGKQKSDKTHPRGANPGGDKEKGFQKGRTLRGGRQPPSCGSPLLSQRQSRCPERSQQSIEAGV